MQDQKCLYLWKQLKQDKKPVVFEIGAHDGWYNSNSRLFRENGCQCVLGEADARHYQSLEKVASEQCKVIMSGLRYQDDGIDVYLDDNAIDGTPDIMFLDIDGGEYSLLAGMKRRPVVICVEFDRTLMADTHYIPRIFGYGHQASALALYELMAAKGYFLADAAFGDLIFVDQGVTENLALKKDIGKDKAYVLTHYWQIGLNPVDSLYRLRYPRDPGNVFAMYQSTMNKLIQNDRRDIVMSIMRSQFHSALPYIYAAGSLERLGSIFDNMDVSWIERWQKAALDYFEFYLAMT